MDDSQRFGDDTFVTVGIMNSPVGIKSIVLLINLNIIIYIHLKLPGLKHVENHLRIWCPHKH